MSPHRRPGWTLANGHAVRSNMEAALCLYLTEMDIGHHHGAQTFDLPLGTASLRLYTTSVTLTGITAGGRAVLIEPIDSVAPGSGLRRLESLRQTHGDDYLVLIVARRPLHPRIPEASYDALFPLEDFTLLLQYLRGLT